MDLSTFLVKYSAGLGKVWRIVTSPSRLFFVFVEGILSPLSFAFSASAFGQGNYGEAG